MTSPMQKQRNKACQRDGYQRKHERMALDSYGWVMSLDSVRTPEEILLVKQRMERLEQHIDRLQPRIARVMRMRLGLNCKAYTFEEIAEQYDVTRERIRQMENKGLRIIKRRIWIEEKPEEYRRQCEAQAKADAERRRAEKAAAAAEAEARKARQDAPPERARSPIGTFKRVERERTILDEIVTEQKRAAALEREYTRWANERAKWLAAPMPDWAQIEPYVNKPYLYKLRKVTIQRDWLKVASEGFHDGA